MKKKLSVSLLVALIWCAPASGSPLGAIGKAARALGKSTEKTVMPRAAAVNLPAKASQHAIEEFRLYFSVRYGDKYHRTYYHDFKMPSDSELARMAKSYENGTPGARARVLAKVIDHVGDNAVPLDKRRNWALPRAGNALLHELTPIEIRQKQLSMSKENEAYVIMEKLRPGDTVKTEFGALTSNGYLQKLDAMQIDDRLALYAKLLALKPVKERQALASKVDELESLLTEVDPKDTAELVQVVNRRLASGLDASGRNKAYLSEERIKSVEELGAFSVRRKQVTSAGSAN